MITVKEVTTKKERKAFFRFPLDLYKGNKYVVPTLIADEEDEFNPEVNDAYRYSETKLFLAYNEQGKVVGRVAGLYHKAYNEKQNLKQLRFTRYDVIDDFEVTKALFAELKKWAQELGMNELVGPIGFSDLDKQGMLIEGFDRVGMYITIYNFPYYREHMEKIGMQKAVDWVEYRIKVPEKMDERLVRLSKKIQERYGYTYVPIVDFKTSLPLIKDALSYIMNEVFAHLYGFVSVSEKQIMREAKMLKDVWNNDYVLAVQNKEGELVGYGFMAPSVSRAMQAFNGKLNLKGIFTMIKDQKHAETLDLYNMGVKKEYQNKGVNVLVMARGLEMAIKNGVKYLETGPELEYNSQIQAQWKDFEKEQHKRRRCWTIPVENL